MILMATGRSSSPQTASLTFANAPSPRSFLMQYWLMVGRPYSSKYVILEHFVLGLISLSPSPCVEAMP